MSRVDEADKPRERVDGHIGPHDATFLRFSHVSIDQDIEDGRHLSHQFFVDMELLLFRTNDEDKWLRGKGPEGEREMSISCEPNRVRDMRKVWYILFEVDLLYR